MLKLCCICEKIGFSLVTSSACLIPYSKQVSADTGMESSDHMLRMSDHFDVAHHYPSSFAYRGLADFRPLKASRIDQSVH